MLRRGGGAMATGTRGVPRWLVGALAALAAVCLLTLASLPARSATAGKRLHSFQYGRCELCKADNECPLAGQYPALCLQSPVVCKACHRAGKVGEARRVDVFKDWWNNANSSAFEPLHCQISACSDGTLTGVGVKDVCTRPCSVVAPCKANEIEVPCGLPHDRRSTRCLGEIWVSDCMLQRMHARLLPLRAPLSPILRQVRRTAQPAQS